jgi:hypothetical protein
MCMYVRVRVRVCLPACVRVLDCRWYCVYPCSCGSCPRYGTALCLFSKSVVPWAPGCGLCCGPCGMCCTAAARVSSRGSHRCSFLCHVVYPVNSRCSRLATTKREIDVFVQSVLLLMHAHALSRMGDSRNHVYFIRSSLPPALNHRVRVIGAPLVWLWTLLARICAVVSEPAYALYAHMCRGLSFLAWGPRALWSTVRPLFGSATTAQVVHTAKRSANCCSSQCRDMLLNRLYHS